MYMFIMIRVVNLRVLIKPINQQQGAENMIAEYRKSLRQNGMFFLSIFLSIGN